MQCNIFITTTSAKGEVDLVMHCTVWDPVMKYKQGSP